MVKPNVLVVCPPNHYVLRSFEAIRPQCGELSNGHGFPELQELARTADVIVYLPPPFAAVSLEAIWPFARRVRWIHSMSAGVEKVLFPALIASPVPVTNARGVFKRSLAEFVVLGMLYFFKHVRRLVESQRAHQWDDFTVEWLPGKIMGIVGYGEIGRECAILAKALGVKIYAIRRNPERSADDRVVDRMFRTDQLPEMLREVDILVAAAPLTPETHHMLSDSEFGVMKPSAIVMNVGRGPVIDEAALIRALQAKQIRGAALDVFENEPLSPESPFWNMENVLLSPHCTDRTGDPDWLDLSAQAFVSNFERYVAGEPLANVVDKKAGY